MSNPILTIDGAALATVSGGTARDPLLNDLTNLASQIKDVSRATSGLSSTEMLLLAFVAFQRQQPAPGVIFVGRPRYYW